MKIYTLLFLLAGALAGCSQQDVNHTKRQLHEAGQEAKQDTRKATEELKKDAHQASREIKRGVNEVKREVNTKDSKDTDRH